MLLFKGQLGPKCITDPFDWPSVAEVSQRLASPSGRGSTLIRGKYRNSIKVNEPGAQPPVFKVITSYFLCFFPPPRQPVSLTVHNRSDPAFIKGGQGQTEHTNRGKTAFNYWGEVLAGDQSPCPHSVSEAELLWCLVIKVISREHQALAAYYSS